jgi:hypothetical protein
MPSLQLGSRTKDCLTEATSALHSRMVSSHVSRRLHLAAVIASTTCAFVTGKGGGGGRTWALATTVSDMGGMVTPSQPSRTAQTSQVRFMRGSEKHYVRHRVASSVDRVIRGASRCATTFAACKTTNGVLKTTSSSSKTPLPPSKPAFAD